MIELLNEALQNPPEFRDDLAVNDLDPDELAPVSTGDAPPTSRRAMTLWTVLCILPLSLCSLSARAADASEARTPIAKLTFDYDAATVSNLSGGLAQTSTYIGNLNLRGLFDLDRALSWKDTTFFIDALWIHGGSPDAAPGDALGVNNLTAPHRAQIEEAWFERNFDGERFSVLAGLYDINTEFYRAQSSGLFLNSGFGIGTELGDSGIEGPSTFPRTSLGVRFAYKPSANTVVRAAVLDGVPVIRPDGRVRAFESGDGELYLVELAALDRPMQSGQKNLRLRIGRNAMLPPYQGKMAIGAWHYTTHFDRLDPGDPRPPKTASGIYGIIDRVVAHVAGDEARAISVFAHVGVGDPTVERFGRSASLGVVSTGLFARRPSDEWGLGFVTGRNGNPYLRQQGNPDFGRAESALELTYLAQINASFALQPDLQYVIRPNADRSVPDAWVFSLRLEVSFGN